MLWRNKECVLLILLIVVTKYLQKQFKRRNSYFGSQFQRCRSIMARRTWWSRTVHIVTVKKHRKGEHSKRSGWDIALKDTSPVTYFLWLWGSPVTYFLWLLLTFTICCNAIILWIHQGINPFITSEPSWSNHLWKCPHRHIQKCPLLIS
jgi:hypothetical protein